MKYRYALLIVFLVIIADQVLKVYIKTEFLYSHPVDIFGDWFKLYFIENEGMAFGMKLSDGSAGKLILTLFRLVAVVVGFFLLKRIVVKGYTRGAIICGALILAGALGNLIDSIFYGMIFTQSTFHTTAQLVGWGEGYGSLFHGKVVDMLYFPIISGVLPDWVPFWGGKHFEFFEPIFNIADASISVGVLVLVFFQKRLIHKKHLAKA